MVILYQIFGCRRRVIGMPYLTLCVDLTPINTLPESEICHVKPMFRERGYTRDTSGISGRPRYRGWGAYLLWSSLNFTIPPARVRLYLSIPRARYRIWNREAPALGAIVGAEALPRRISNSAPIRAREEKRKPATPPSLPPSFSPFLSTDSSGSNTYSWGQL